MINPKKKLILIRKYIFSLILTPYTPHLIFQSCCSIVLENHTINIIEIGNRTKHKSKRFIKTTYTKKKHIQQFYPHTPPHPIWNEKYQMNVILILFSSSHRLICQRRKWQCHRKPSITLLLCFTNWIFRRQYCKHSIFIIQHSNNTRT